MNVLARVVRQGDWVDGLADGVVVGDERSKLFIFAPFSWAFSLLIWNAEHLLYFKLINIEFHCMNDRY